MTKRYNDGPVAFMVHQFNKMPALPAANLHGMRYLITGANGGVGFAIAKHIVSLKGDVVMAVRNVPSGEKARTQLQTAYPDSNIDVKECDLERLESVMALKRDLASAGERGKLDGVFLNAAIYVRRWDTAPSGFEKSIQVNVLSNGLLALLLIPLFRKNPGATPPPLVMVSSEAHAFTPFAERSAPSILAALNDRAAFNRNITDRYYVSKLLNLLWTLQLSRKVDPQRVRITLASPGFCKSNLFWQIREVEGVVAGWFVALNEKLFARTADEGSKMVVHAALSDPVHGAYYSQGGQVPTSAFTTSSDGMKAQVKVWKEVHAELSKACPGLNLGESWVA